MYSESETILQFGTGRFLRAFADLFVHQANEGGQAVGHIVVVQSTGAARADNLNASREGYHVAVRGYQNGHVVDRTETVRSISRALVAATQWADVLAVAASPKLRIIVSNTTETGYILSPEDNLKLAPSPSFPAKLTQVLWHRFEAGQPPVLILPCELIEGNASKLRDIVADLSRLWGLGHDFVEWMTNGCTWLNSLVDRIVVGPSKDHPLFDKDPMLATAEPYALWAIERPPDRELAFFKHPSIEIVDDLSPYYLRKVRILNGLHTALAAKYLSKGLTTVQQAMKDAAIVDWVLGLLYEEIMPVIAYRVDDVARFARQTLERFQNPFQEHKLSDIAINHEAKRQIRLQTTFDEYVKLFGKKPKRLQEVI